MYINLAGIFSTYMQYYITETSANRVCINLESCKHIQQDRWKWAWELNQVPRWIRMEYPEGYPYRPWNWSGSWGSFPAPAELRHPIVEPSMDRSDQELRSGVIQLYTRTRESRDNPATSTWEIKFKELRPPGPSSNVVAQQAQKSNDPELSEWDTRPRYRGWGPA